MKMNFKQAFKKISADDLRNIESKNYYLNSLVSVLPANGKEIEQFIFNFFNPQEMMIMQAIVSDSGVEIKQPQKALSPTTEKLNFLKITIYSKAIIEKALAEFKKTKEKMNQIIISLQQCSWKVMIVTKSLHVFVIEFDANTGDIKNSRLENLVK